VKYSLFNLKITIVIRHNSFIKVQANKKALTKRAYDAIVLVTDG